MGRLAILNSFCFLNKNVRGMGTYSAWRICACALLVVSCMYSAAAEPSPSPDPKHGHGHHSKKSSVTYPYLRHIIDRMSQHDLDKLEEKLAHARFDIPGDDDEPDHSKKHHVPSKKPKHDVSKKTKIEAKHHSKSKPKHTKKRSK